MFKQTLRLATLGLIAALSLPASAIYIEMPTNFITWEGVCLDCLAGEGGQAGGGVDTGNPSTATAIFGVSSLGNGANGSTDLTNGNLLTFSYTSAYLGTLNSYSINYAIGLISGEVDSYAQSPVSVLFRVGSSSGPQYNFLSDTFGDWSLQLGGELDDFGTQGVFNVPAPATLALFGLGVAGLGWTRRSGARKIDTRTRAG